MIFLINTVEYWAKLQEVFASSVWVLAFYVIDILSYIVHIVVRFYTRLRCTRSNYKYCKVSHNIIEAIALTNAVIGFLVFWTNSNLHSYKAEVDYQQAIGSIYTMLLLRFLYMISLLCKLGFYLVNVVLYKYRINISLIEGIELISAEELNRR